MNFFKNYFYEINKNLFDLDKKNLNNFVKILSSLKKK